MDQDRRCLSFLCLLCVAAVVSVSGQDGQCTDPLAAEPVSATRLSDFQVTYALDDPVVYECDQDEGYGYIVVRCADSGWGEADRGCTDATNIEPGSIVGIVVFLVTVVITFAFIIASTIHSKKTKAADADAAEASTSDATPNGTARKGSLAPCKPNSHRRHSVAQMLE